MKTFRLFPLIFSLLLLVSLFTLPAQAAEPVTGAGAVLAAELTTDTVCFTRGEDTAVNPGKSARMMTLLLTIEAVEAEKLSLYDSLTASAWLNTGLSAPDSVGLAEGESLPLEDLLYCAAVGSSDAACNILAEAVSGTVDGFVQQMNQRAEELGCTNTHFLNTHGAALTGQYTTVQDMYLICREALRHTLLAEICAQVSYDLPATNLAGMRELVSGNLLLGNSAAYPEYKQETVTGVCAGDGCLICLDSRNDMQLLEIVLDAEGGVTAPYDDALAISDWFFDTYSFVDVLSSSAILAELHVSMASGTDTIAIRPERSISVLLPKDTDLSRFRMNVVIYSEAEGRDLVAPINAGEVLGQITVSDDETTYGTVNLVASNSVALSKADYLKSQLKATWQRKAVHGSFWVLVLLLVVYAVFVVRYRIRRRQYVQEVRQATAGQPAPVPETPRARRKSLSLPRRRTPAPPPPEAEPEAPAPDRTEGIGVPITSGSMETQEDRDFFEEFFGGHHG